LCGRIIEEAADRLARRRRISRSELEALALLLVSDESSSITERLDDVCDERPSEPDSELSALQALAIDED
jgi:hypothetical protein